MSLLSDLFNFLKNPTQKPITNNDNYDRFWQVLRLISISVFTGITLSLLANFVFNKTFSLPSSSIQITEMAKTVQIWQAIFTITILAPTIEELCFRFVASRKSEDFFFGLGFMFIFFFSLISEIIARNTGNFFGIKNLNSFQAYLIYLFGMMIILILTQINYQKISAKTEKWLAKKQTLPIIIYSSSLLFALAHLSNYKTLDWKISFLIITQFLLGLIYSYTRIKLGFWLAVVCHIGYNSVLIILLAMPQLILEKLNQITNITNLQTFTQVFTELPLYNQILLTITIFCLFSLYITIISFFVQTLVEFFGSKNPKRQLGLDKN
jgi:hypothetical protein